MFVFCLLCGSHSVTFLLMTSKLRTLLYSRLKHDVFQEAAQALLSAQQVGCAWPNITDKIGEYLGRAEVLKQLRGCLLYTSDAADE